MPQNHPKEGVLQPNTPWGVGYEGPGPEPARSAAFVPADSRGYEVNQDYGASPQNAVPGALPAEIQATPPPANPDQASELAELKRTVGELTAGIGEMKQTHRRELEEARLLAEFAQSANRPSQIPINSLPPGVNLEDPVNAGTLINTLNQLIPRMEVNFAARAIRDNWDVTPEEIAAVAARHPQMNTFTEPDLSRFILRMVKFQRSQTAETAPAGEPTQTVAPQVTQPQTREIPGRVVPQTEAVSDPRVAETPAMHPVEAAQRNYAEAEALPARTDMERKERMRQKRIAFDALNVAKGLTEDAQKHQGFQQKS